MNNIFNKIYDENKWDCGSGPGSSKTFCKPFIEFFKKYILDNNIKSICDIGCGDLQWIPDLVLETNIKYIGLDCVEKIINENKKLYTSKQFNFILIDIFSYNLNLIPFADLYFMKDALQHWESDQIVVFLNNWFNTNPNTEFIVVNCNYQSNDDRHLDEYHFCPLNKNYYPLKNYNIQELFTWNNKSVYKISV